jgi:hypothetical protein
MARISTAPGSTPSRAAARPSALREVYSWLAADSDLEQHDRVVRGQLGPTPIASTRRTAFATLGFIGEHRGHCSFEDKNDRARLHRHAASVVQARFDDIYGDAGVYPSTVGFFQQRRIFANTDRNPNRFFMTQVGNFSNMSAAVPPEDSDAIIATIAARRINEILHIVPLSDLVMLTSGWRVPGVQPQTRAS